MHCLWLWLIKGLEMKCIKAAHSPSETPPFLQYWYFPSKLNEQALHQLYRLAECFYVQIDKEVDE